MTAPSKQVLTRDVSQAADCTSNNVQYFHGYTGACCYCFLSALAAPVLLVLRDWVLFVVGFVVVFCFFFNENFSYMRGAKYLCVLQ